MVNIKNIVEDEMKLPTYFELDGKYAAMLPTKRGGVEVVKQGGSPSIAQFMSEGTVVALEDLPADFREALLEELPTGDK